MADNIFDILSKGSKSKGGKASPAPKKTSDPQAEELDLMFQKMRTMKQDLEDQLANLYLQGKMTPHIEALLVENPTKLTKKQLEEIAEQENKLKEKISKAIPPETCLQKNPKSKVKLTQERRGKLRGAKNKWIPMR